MKTTSDETTTTRTEPIDPRGERVREIEANRAKPGQANSSSFAETGYKMIKRQPPKHVNFAEGEILDGILIKVELIRVQGKQTARYTMRELTGGNRFTFLGLQNIDNQIDPADLGHRISITCVGTTPPRIQGQSPMKIFDIIVSDKKLAEVLTPIDGGPITDDDLPPAEAY
jgi:hypothetical protein